MCLAVPGKILEVKNDADALARSGRVEFGGVVKEINLSYTPEAGPGDYVIVHAGFALSVMDEEEARQVLTLLEQIEPPEAE